MFIFCIFYTDTPAECLHETSNLNPQENVIKTHTTNDLTLNNLTLDDLPWSNQSNVDTIAHLDDSDFRSTNLGKFKKLFNVS